MTCLMSDRLSKYCGRQDRAMKPFLNRKLLATWIENNLRHLWDRSDSELGRHADLERDEVYCKLERVRSMSLKSEVDNLLYESVSAIVSRYHKKMDNRIMKERIYNKILESSDEELLEEFTRKAYVGLRMDTRNNFVG